MKQSSLLFLYLIPMVSKTVVSPAKLTAYAQEQSQLSERLADLDGRIDALRRQTSAMLENVRTTNTRIMYARNALITCAAVTVGWLTVEGIHYYFKHRKKPNRKQHLKS